MRIEEIKALFESFKNGSTTITGVGGPYILSDPERHFLFSLLHAIVEAELDETEALSTLRAQKSVQSIARDMLTGKVSPDQHNRLVRYVLDKTTDSRLINICHEILHPQPEPPCCPVNLQQKLDTLAVWALTQP